MDIKNKEISTVAYSLPDIASSYSKYAVNKP